MQASREHHGHARPLLKSFQYTMIPCKARVFGAVGARPAMRWRPVQHDNQRVLSHCKGPMQDETGFCSQYRGFGGCFNSPRRFALQSSTPTLRTGCHKLFFCKSGNSSWQRAPSYSEALLRTRKMSVVPRHASIGGILYSRHAFHCNISYGGVLCEHAGPQFLRRSTETI